MLRQAAILVHFFVPKSTFPRKRPKCHFQPNKFTGFCEIRTFEVRILERIQKALFNIKVKLMYLKKDI